MQGSGDYMKLREQRTLKRLVVFWVVLLLRVFAVLSCAKKVPSKPDCVSSYSSNSEYSLTIIANRKSIDDKEAFDKELIEHVKDNNFKTILFSYDATGYPTSLQMTIYLNEKEWKNHNLFMTATFKQDNILDNYNIVEHYDKFTLKIDAL